LQELAWAGDDAYAKVNVTVDDQGESTRFEVCFAYVGGDECKNDFDPWQIYSYG
jgi:hypothetical protein